jgi:hypothetical protein
LDKSHGRLLPPNAVPCVPRIHSIETPSYSSASPPLRNSLRVLWRLRVQAGQLTILPVNPVALIWRTQQDARMANAMYHCRTIPCEKRKKKRKKTSNLSKECGRHYFTTGWRMENCLTLLREEEGIGDGFFCGNVFRSRPLFSSLPTTPQECFNLRCLRGSPFGSSRSSVDVLLGSTYKLPVDPRLKNSSMGGIKEDTKSSFGWSSSSLRILDRRIQN